MKVHVPHPGGHLRRLFSVFMTLVAGSVAAVAIQSPAFAGTSAPLAFGQTDDDRVLGVVSTASGSRVKAIDYVSGSGAIVNMQRWTFQKIVAGGGTPETTYRIRNVAADLCMEKDISGGDVNAAAVILAPCALVSHQYWYLSPEFYFDRYTVRSARDHRCLDAAYVESGADVDVYSCFGLDSQQWDVRSGTQRCQGRVVIALCVRPSQPLFGIIANWRHQPVSFAGPDYNQLRNFLSWETSAPSGGTEEYDYFELGWSADYDAGTAATSHTAFWLEQNIDVYEFHSVAGGSTADGVNHTYMALANDAGQWDIFFDFNPVGSTSVADGAQLSYLESTVTSYYNEQILLANGFENRLQVMTGNNIFRKVWAGESGMQETNTCYAPPNPYLYGQPDSPPWCFTPRLALRQADGGLQADYFAVDKPQVTSVHTAGPPTRQLSSEHFNGVDQTALASCLDSAADAAECLRTVPGPAQCVAARKICNNDVAQAPRIPSHRRAFTPADAREAVSRLITTDTRIGITPERVAVLPVVQYTVQTGKGLSHIASSEDVIVVAGDETVTSRTSRTGNRTYPGYQAAFDAATGALLHLCLGASCRTVR